MKIYFLINFIFNLKNKINQKIIYVLTFESIDLITNL